jgi:hypothetical protein
MPTLNICLHCADTVVRILLYELPVVLCLKLVYNGGNVFLLCAFFGVGVAGIAPRGGVGALYTFVKRCTRIILLFIHTVVYCLSITFNDGCQR